MTPEPDTVRNEPRTADTSKLDNPKLDTSTRKGQAQRLKTLTDDLLHGGNKQEAADALAQASSRKAVNLIFNAAKGGRILQQSDDPAETQESALRALRFRSEPSMRKLYYEGLLRAVRERGGVPSPQLENDVRDLGKRSDKESLALLCDIVTCRKSQAYFRDSGSLSLEVRKKEIPLLEIRKAAVEALSERLAPHELMEFLEETALAGDTNPFARRSVIKAILSRSEEAAIRTVEKLLGRSDVSKMRREGILALTSFSFGPDFLRLIEMGLNDDNVGVYAAAVSVLARRHEPEALCLLNSASSRAEYFHARAVLKVRNQ